MMRKPNTKDGMISTTRRAVIEGLPSAGAGAASAQRPAGTPAFKLGLRRALRMHPKLAAWVAGLTFLLIAGYALTRPPLWQAESLTYVEPVTSKLLSDGTGGGYDPARYDSYLQQQMQTAVRPDILAAALHRLPAGTWVRPGETEQSAVGRLGDALKVQRVLTSYQLSISLTGTNPEATASTVNAVTSSYLEQGRKDEHAISDQRLQLLSAERQRLDGELAANRAEQASLGVSLGVANPVGDTGNPYDLQLAGVRSQVSAAREANDVAAAQLASVRGAGGARSAGLAAAADELIANDAGLNSLKSTINQRRAVLSSQMAGLTAGNPLYKQDQEEIADLDRSLDAATVQLRDKAERRVESKARLDLARTSGVQAMLSNQLARQTATATGAGPKLQRAYELAANIQRLTARYAAVDDAMRGLELEANGPGLAHLSVAATVPANPEPSRKKLLLLLALPLALILGAGAAVWAHRRDPRVYTARDMETVLGFVPMGVVPAREEVSAGVVEEYMLRLAAGIESAYRVSSARSYVFTGASAGIEVSGFVAGIRAKLEQLGFSAAVVNARELMRPVAGADEERAVRVREAAREGFAAGNVERLAERHNMVLIDAPPLLYSAEAEHVVRCADATILIAESGVTERGELRQAGLLLERLNVAGVGTVLQELHLRVAGPAFKSAVEVLERRGAEVKAEVPGRPAGREGVGERIRYAAAPVEEPVAVEEQVSVRPAVWPVGEAPEAAVAEPVPERYQAGVAEAVEAAKTADAWTPPPVETERAGVPEAAAVEATPVVVEEPAQVAREEGRSEEGEEHRSWWERLLGKTEQPTERIVPGNTAARRGDDRVADPPMRGVASRAAREAEAAAVSKARLETAEAAPAEVPVAVEAPTAAPEEEALEETPAGTWAALMAAEDADWRRKHAAVGEPVRAEQKLHEPFEGNAEVPVAREVAFDEDAVRGGSAAEIVAPVELAAPAEAAPEATEAEPVQDVGAQKSEGVAPEALGAEPVAYAGAAEMVVAEPVELVAAVEAPLEAVVEPVAVLRARVRARYVLFEEIRKERAVRVVPPEALPATAHAEVANLVPAVQPVRAVAGGEAEAPVEVQAQRVPAAAMTTARWEPDRRARLSQTAARGAPPGAGGAAGATAGVAGTGDRISGGRTVSGRRRVAPTPLETQGKAASSSAGQGGTPQGNGPERINARISGERPIAPTTGRLTRSWSMLSQFDRGPGPTDLEDGEGSGDYAGRQ